MAELARAIQSDAGAAPQIGTTGAAAMPGMPGGSSTGGMKMMEMDACSQNPSHGQKFETR